ncbi:hypothetical protein MJN51_37420, partial [Salmonella enterica subsp. enterica serovar Kentucky]|nr:hypothetical protein [Salmonella enterica subsp. enterica serovar Kentucky]
QFWRGQQGQQQPAAANFVIAVTDARQHPGLFNAEIDMVRKITYGVIPIIAYQADAYKTDPSASHEKELINWWSVVARYFGQTSP